jgi:hypothetical protein
MFPGLGAAAAAMFPQGRPELQRAMDIYQQELSRLQQNAIVAAMGTQNGGRQVKEDSVKEASEEDDDETHKKGVDAVDPSDTDKDPVSMLGKANLRLFMNNNNCILFLFIRQNHLSWWWQF